MRALPHEHRQQVGAMEETNDPNLNLVPPRAKARVATTVRVTVIWQKNAQKSERAAQEVTHLRGRATVARHHTIVAAPRASTARLGGIKIRLTIL